MPAHTEVYIDDVRLPVREHLREGLATTATSRQTTGTQEFSLAEIARLRGILGGSLMTVSWMEISWNTFSQPPFLTV